MSTGVQASSAGRASSHGSGEAAEHGAHGRGSGCQDLDRFSELERSHRSPTLAGRLVGRVRFSFVVGGGFEPPKAEPPDLQSGPFGRLGTPPERPTRGRGSVVYRPAEERHG